jgi:diadenosine tetraphosphate (Ap4A) HIT family hydrolase
VRAGQLAEEEASGEEKKVVAEESIGEEDAATAGWLRAVLLRRPNPARPGHLLPIPRTCTTHLPSARS